MNDGSTAGDLWCTATGSVSNAGTSSNAPARSIQQIVNGTNLAGGDVVYVDTGSYALSNNVTLTPDDSGSPVGGVVTIRGAGADKTRIDRGSTSGGAHGFHLNAASYVVIRDLRCGGADQGVRIENASHCEVRNCRLEQNNSGVVLSGGSDHTVADSTVCSNLYQGILGSSSAGPVLSGNTIFRQSDGALSLRDVGGEAVGNRVYLNDGHGMFVSIGGAVRRNTVYSNGRHGMVVDCWYGANTVINNLVYDNDRRNEGWWNIAVNRSGGDRIENNTVFGANGIYWEGPWGDVMRHNVIWAKGSGRYAVYHNNNSAKPVSDFNNLYATDGAQVGYWGGARAALADWQAASGLDSNSLSANPRLVDPDGADDALGGTDGVDDDFHLASKAGSYHGGTWALDATNSPCIDAGDITAAFTNEPAFNGNRLNLGAYGNTEQASKTDYSGPFYTVAVTSAPWYGGSVAIWPQTTNYMAGQPARLAATTNLNFQFAGWTGSLVVAANPHDFAVGSSMAVTGLFTVVTGGAAAVYGNLRFQTATSSVMEDAGSAVIWVRRTNGLNSSVSVDYFTADDTALAGSDYTATSGTLAFAHGVASNSFTVPITEDAPVESTEQFRVFLTNPQGGAALGSVTGMTVQIVEDDVPDPLVITTTALPLGTVGVAYAASVAATGGVPPFAWAVSSGMTESFGDNSFGNVGTGITLRADEGTRLVALPFSFPYYGGSYTQLWVDINGKLRLDSSAGDPSPTSNELVTAKMIAVLWKDLRTDSVGGDVFIQTNAADATIRWQGVYYSGGLPVSFSVTLYGTGYVRMRYGPGNANGGLIGVSAGDGTNCTFGSRSQAGSLSNALDAVYATMPPGLVLSAASGAISGTPQVAGTWNVKFQVTDLFAASTNRTLTMAVWGDADGDGMPDDYEQTYFGGATNGNPNGDADGDRFKNLWEYRAGTIPTNGWSYLGMKSATATTTGTVVRWSSVAGKSYALDRATNLVAPGFVSPALATGIGATAPTNSYTDTNAVGRGPFFYRIRLE